MTPTKGCRMFNRQKPAEQLSLEKEIASVHADMAGLDALTQPDEYKAALKRLDKLHALHAPYRRERVNPNTLITTAGSVASIIIIVGYERSHVFSSAAKNFVRQIGK
jgi:hypothetical protein